MIRPLRSSFSFVPSAMRRPAAARLLWTAFSEHPSLLDTTYVPVALGCTYNIFISKGTSRHCNGRWRQMEPTQEVDIDK